MREATEVGTTHQGMPGPPGAPRWVVPPSGHPSGTSSAQVVPSGPEKISKKFVAFGLRLVLIFCEAKKATGTGHYVNRLVPKNDIKLQQNDYKTSKNDNITAWNNKKL